MNHRTLLLVPLVVGLAACGGSADAPPPVFSLQVLEPAVDLTIGLGYGGVLEVAYVDHDSIGEAATDLFADVDGDLETTDDRFPLATARAEQNGRLQRVDWDVGGTPHGLYHVIARMRSGSDEIVAAAPGRVRLDAPPTLEILRPDPTTVTCRGGILRLSCQSLDPEGPPLDTLWADRDGDAWTTSDQYVLVEDAPGGALRDGLVRAWDVPLGTYEVLGRTRDGVNPDVKAAAPGGLDVVNVGWVSTGGPSGADADAAAATYADFSSVVAGTFRGSITFGSGTESETTLEAVAYDDLCVARHAADGSLIWARSDGGEGLTRARDADGYADGACVVAGAYSGTITFGAGETSERTFTAASSADGFVAKYEVDGTLAWARQIACDYYAESRGVKALADGGAVVVGTFLTPATFDPGGPNEITLTPVGAHDVFVVRYTAGGDLAWVRQAGGPSVEDGRGVTGLPDGSFVICGHCSDQAVFGAGEAAETTIHSAGSYDVFVARYLSDGTLAWATSAGGTPWETAADVAAGPDGSCFVTGSFLETATFGAGEPRQTVLTSAGDRDGFIARYGMDGSLIWARRFGGPRYDAAEALTSFADGTLVVTGRFKDVATFAPESSAPIPLTSQGLDDVFHACYDADGRLMWARSMGGLGNDQGWAIAGFADGSFLAAGAFHDLVVFGPGDPRETVRAAIGSSDLYVARFNGDGGL